MDFWAAVAETRHHYEKTIAVELWANELVAYAVHHKSDVDSAKKTWRTAMDAKGKAFWAYKQAMEDALKSGQPMPECWDD